MGFPNDAVQSAMGTAIYRQWSNLAKPSRTPHKEYTAGFLCNLVHPRYLYTAEFPRRKICSLSY